MTIYIRYDRVNNEVVEHYDRAEDIIKSADEFYHDTFKNEDSYDENLDIKTIEEAIELYEGSAFEIYVLLDNLIKQVKGEK